MSPAGAAPGAAAARCRCGRTAGTRPGHVTGAAAFREVCAERERGGELPGSPAGTAACSKLRRGNPALEMLLAHGSARYNMNLEEIRLAYLALFKKYFDVPSPSYYSPFYF